MTFAAVVVGIWLIAYFAFATRGWGKYAKAMDSQGAVGCATIVTAVILLGAFTSHCGRYG